MKYLKLNIKYTDIRNKEAFYFHHTLGYFDYLKNYVITMEQFLVIKLLKKVLKWTRFFLLSKICALLNYESTSQTYLFVDVLQNSCFSKFRNIHRKTPVLESLFNKVFRMSPEQFDNLLALVKPLIKKRRQFAKINLCWRKTLRKTLRKYLRIPGKGFGF